MTEAKTHQTHAMNFGQRLRVALAAADIRQSGLAEETGVSPAAVSNWCKGKCYPSIEALEIICDITGASLEWLLWPHPVDLTTTELAINGVHIKNIVRQTMEDLKEARDADQA